ncbi:MAG: hypothetical protein IT260_02405 [Saprospiraceae bacterium]|nr:hypothetical protein [Saprospiraceae bacterium]
MPPLLSPFQRAVLPSEFLPFARPDYVEGMILGDDLDSLLSGAYLHARFGWPVVGLYCGFNRLWHAGPEPAFRQALLAGRYFAVDLDICHPTVPSLGHHMLQLDAATQAIRHTHVLNPNELAGFDAATGFRRKYPLATIHFLLWLFDENEWAQRFAELVWLADSSFVNAQQYRPNVAYWVNTHLSLPAFAATLTEAQTLVFEKKLRDRVLSVLEENPLCRPNPAARHRSRHLGLSGWQCQFSDPNDPNLRDLLRRLHEGLGWPLLPLPEHFGACWKGHRKQIAVADIRSSGLTFGDWLERNDVFSYAWVYRERLNYTVLA